MASGALFGGSVGGRSQSKNLVEVKAGKMFMKGKICHPDKRKGLLYVYQSEDSLMHFCWKERSKSHVEDDLIIFPDDTEYKHVPQCTTGRIYVLKFKSSNRKCIFWMQEPKSDKDEDVCRKINDFLNNPPTPGSSRAAGGGAGNLPAELAGLGETDLQSILGNMSQQQLMQLLGGMGMGGGSGGGLGGLSALMGGRPASAQSTDSAPPLRVQSSPGPRATDSVSPQQPRPVTAAALPTQQQPTTMAQPETQTPQQAIQLSDLQNILTSMNAPGQQSEAIDLSQAVNPELMIPILANPDVQAQLLPHLPEGESLPRNEAELRNTISSPQFKQAMSSFSAALASGELGPLMAQFGLGDDVANAAAKGDVEAFVRAMQNTSSTQDKKDETKEDK